MNVCVITESWMKTFIIIIYFICVADLYCGLRLMEVTYTRAQNRKQLKMDPLTSLFSKLLDHPPQGISHKPFSSGHVYDFLGASFPFSFRHHFVSPPVPGAGLFFLSILIQPGTFLHNKSPIVVFPTVGA